MSISTKKTKGNKKTTSGAVKSHRQGSPTRHSKQSCRCSACRKFRSLIRYLEYSNEGKRSKTPFLEHTKQPAPRVRRPNTAIEDAMAKAILTGRAGRSKLNQLVKRSFGGWSKKDNRSRHTQSSLRTISLARSVTPDGLIILTPITSQRSTLLFTGNIGKLRWTIELTASTLVFWLVLCLILSL